MRIDDPDRGEANGATTIRAVCRHGIAVDGYDGLDVVRTPDCGHAWRWRCAWKGQPRPRHPEVQAVENVSTGTKYLFLGDAAAGAALRACDAARLRQGCAAGIAVSVVMASMVTGLGCRCEACQYKDRNDNSKTGPHLLTYPLMTTCTIGVVPM
jgi:hypothetical protein